MNNTEVTINAAIDANGQLQLSHTPQLPPGPVQVTIRTITAAKARRGIADIAREIRAEQIARGYHGLTFEDLQKMEAELQEENDAYDREMERLGALLPPGSGAG